jgi:hypothetical protein
VRRCYPWLSLPVRPRGSGDPGPCTRTSPSLGPRFRGDERRMLLRPFLPTQLSKSSVRLDEVQERSVPVSALGQGIARIPSFPHRRQFEGMARRQGARPGSPGRKWHGLRPGPGREASRPAPCGAPTRHLRLTPQSALGPHQELSVPGGLIPRPPVGQACVIACPQVPLPVPALRTPPETPLVEWIGYVTLAKLSPVVKSRFVTESEGAFRTGSRDDREKDRGSSSGWFAAAE